MDPHLTSAIPIAVRRVGTPCYVYDLPRLDADAALVAEAFPDPWLRLYSLKANGLPALISRIASAGFGATVVSSGELDLARRAGFPTSRIALEGIGKTDRELREAVRLAVGGTPLLWTSLESADEARVLAGLARAAGIALDVLVRVNPQLQAETHDDLAVGAPASKFGVLADELGTLVDAGGGPRGPLRWRGIHLHIGSQLGAIDAWRSAARIGHRLLALQRAALPDFDTLDLGSGFPVDYGVDGAVPGPTLFADAASEELAMLPDDAQPRRRAIEPGRALVAVSGWLIGRVLHVRERPAPDGPTRIVVLDTGMTELIRTALYGAEHPMVAITSGGRMVGPDALLTSARVDGPICESTDTLGVAGLPPLSRGDLVAIGVVGAYGSSMASTYNGRPRPAELGWDGERFRTLRRRGGVGSLP